MGSYKLNILFDSENLPTIYEAGEQVVIVKHTSTDSNPSSPHVAWVTFKPFEKNTVEWTTEFAVYASNTKTEEGAIINKLSDKYAATRVDYHFNKGTFINAQSEPTVGANTYVVSNDSTDTPYLTFGLAQSVNVNGDAYANHPINAIAVPIGHKADMTPYERVDVYLKSQINNGTVLSNIGSIALPVDYEGAATEHTIAYDGSTGRFSPVK